MRQVNYRGSFQFSNRLLEDLLNLPEGVRVTGLSNNPARQTTEFYIQSEEKIEGFTFECPEGATPVSINYDSYVKHVNDFAKNLSVEEVLNKKPRVFKNWR